MIGVTALAQSGHLDDQGGSKLRAQGGSKLRFSRTFDDGRPPTHTGVPILTGFSVVPARSGTVLIKSAGRPTFSRSVPRVMKSWPASLFTSASGWNASTACGDDRARPDFMKRWSS